MPRIVENNLKMPVIVENGVLNAGNCREWSMECREKITKCWKLSREWRI